MLIRARAPLRVSFAGGGTDVPPFPEREGGCVLNATINKYVYGSLQTRMDGQIVVESLDLGIVMNYEPGMELVYDGKLDLVKATIRKLVGKQSQGFSMCIYSDVPPGTGLGSSSAVSVTLIGLLMELQKLPLTNYEIAQLAFDIERKELGIKGGWQDQYAAVFGGFNFIEFNADGTIVNPLKLMPSCIAELEASLLLCYTGRTRLSDRIIEDQTRRYQQGDEKNIRALRRQKELAVEMKNALLRYQLSEFGRLLNEAWEVKKAYSPKISSSYIDELYAAARGAGALGGKITGAGGGGYMLLYCPFERKSRVAEVLRRKGLAIMPFTFEFQGLQTWRVDND